MLASLGYVPISHTHPEDALEFLDTNAEDVDLVVLDLNMPGRTPEDMLAEVRRRCPEAPILLASGSETGPAVDDLLNSGAAGFIPKPFRLNQLAQALRNTLDAKRPTDPA